ncbi:hypothetical protein LguiB_027401 [Lonicera macranthoides]
MLFENLPLFEAFTCLLFSLGGAGDNTAMKLIRCKDNERQALLDLKKEFMDNGGFHLSSWGSQEEDRCKWRGIRCSNNTGHVILLDLRGWYDYGIDNLVCLSGKVRPSLLELNQLKYLDLSDNSFYSSPIPKFISPISKLQHLNLSSAGFAGRVLHQLGNLPNLRSLHLGVNYNLTIENLEWLSDLHLLRHLDLSLIDLEKLRSQSNLIFLHMSNVGIFDTVPHWFRDLLPRLKYLNILDNHIHGMLPDLFLEFVKLDQIDLSSNRFEGPIPSFPRNLSLLNLFKNMFSGSIILVCTIVTEFLSFLDLSDNLLSGEVPYCWINANNLQILDLSNNNLFQKIPATFGFLNQLVLLNLRNNSFIGELPSSLKNYSALIVIDISENKLLRKL